MKTTKSSPIRLKKNKAEYSKPKPIHRDPDSYVSKNENLSRSARRLYDRAKKKGL